MFFSVITMLVAAIYTVYGLLWVKLFRWTKDAVEASILLNVDVLASTGALNAQDAVVAMLTDLRISQSFVQSIIDEGASSKLNETDYLKNYSDMTVDSLDIALANIHGNSTY